MVRDEVKFEERLIVPNRWIILGFHKTKGFVYGKKVFKTEQKAHDFWAELKSKGLVKNYKFYFVIPK